MRRMTTEGKNITMQYKSYQRQKWLLLAAMLMGVMAAA